MSCHFNVIVIWPNIFIFLEKRLKISSSKYIMTYLLGDTTQRAYLKIGEIVLDFISLGCVSCGEAHDGRRTARIQSIR